MRIGDLANDEAYPCPVTIGGQRYFILKNETGYSLASSICPHQGGLIHHASEDGCFRCPLHNWEFDSASGAGINTASGMTTMPLEARDGGLWIDDALVRLRDVPKIRQATPTLTDLGKSPDLTFRLLAHASLEITATSRQILIDPWLDGPAMLGAWRQYPRFEISAKDLSPTAIVITHEHSDHFHIPTLRGFDRTTPIFVPAFGNGRLEYFLEKFGFQNVHSTPFDTTVRVTDRVKLQYFRPVSIFNDSIMLLTVDGFKLLNLNDAGLNASIADRVGPVDLVSCIFSTGASGYPMTWSHLDDAEKLSIMQRACAGRLDMLAEAVKLYRANRLLPFASYFRLWLPEHRDYLAAMKTNTLLDVVDHFESRGMRDVIVDLLPGERWNPSTNATTYIWEDRATLFRPETIASVLAADHRDHGQDLSIHDYWGTATSGVTKDIAATYFERLNSNPDIRHCENVRLRVRCFSRGWEVERFEIWMSIRDSVLTIDPDETAAADLPVFHLDVTEDILEPILHDNLSWDEARVGCHLRWWRNTNAVHTGLLRLLQGPYGQRSAEQQSMRLHGVSAEHTIASVVEVHGAAAEEILARWGLYCTGCSLSPWESVSAGARKHGLSDADVRELLREISAIQA